MNRVTPWTESVRQILEEEANVLARESGFIQRVRVLSGAAEQRRQHVRAEAHDHGHEPSAETLSLAGWIIVVTHVPRRRLRLAETLLATVDKGLTDRRMALHEALAHRMRRVCQTGGDGAATLAQRAGLVARSAA